MLFLDSLDNGRDKFIVAQSVEALDRIGAVVQFHKDAAVDALCFEN